MEEDHYLSQITLQCMLPGHYYKKYLAKLDPTRQPSLHQDSFRSRKEELVSILSTVIDTPEELPTALVESWRQSIQMAVDYLETTPACSQKETELQADDEDEDEMQDEEELQEEDAKQESLHAMFGFYSRHHTTIKKLS
jgi:hypothetical protein